MQANPRHSHTEAARDRGWSLVETLVAIVLTSVVIGLGLGLLISSQQNAQKMTERHYLWNEMNNASVQLVRDISDGSKIRTAQADRFVIDVVRDGKCQTRDWTADQTSLKVTTTFYDGVNCTGGSKKSDAKAGITQLMTTPTPFTYFSTLSGANEMSSPVDPLQVGRVGWVLATEPADTTSVLRLESGAAFTPKGSQTDGTGQVENAKAPFLEITTNTAGVEGIDKPVLSWTDLTPELTSGWAVFRITNPEGTVEGDPGRSTWTQLAFIPTATPAPAKMTYTDVSLPAGHTAQYVVRAVIPAGSGPESNQVVTGLRPAAPASITVDGAGTALNLSWPAAVGATGYDLYRSEGGASESGNNTLVLYKRWSDIKAQVSTGPRLTWSEAPGYGRSYNYTVVATNRWEHVATDPARKSQTREVAVSTLENARVNGTAAKHERLRPARDGDFTAAATPTFTLALNSSTSATDYSTQVTWTPAAWTGGGPVSVDGRARDVWWSAQRAGADIWTKSTTSPRRDAGTSADATYGYRVQTCNDSGCSPWAGERRLIQRPAVPSCTAGVSGLTTRQATVTSATSSSASSWQVQKVSGPGSAGMGGVKDTNGSRQVVYNELGHSAAHTWQSRSTNVRPAGVEFGSGTSAWGGACGATTTPLRVWLSDGSATTRSVSARLHNEGGNNANLTVEGNSTQPSNGGGQAHTFDWLVHNQTYTLTARLTDGYNDVAYQDTIATQRLADPGLSFGAVTTRTVQAYVSCANGNSCTVGRDSGGGSGSGTTFDYLTHGTSHGFYGRNSDGYNVVTSLAYRSTNVLTVGTPTCSASRSGQYAPATVYFSSNGSLSRTSANASSAGYYSAVATMTNSDGYNTVSRTNSCGVSVEQRPWVSVGGGGTPSPSCAPYTGIGAVQNLLRAAVMGGGQTVQGLVVGSPVRGPGADYGSVLKGSAAGGDLQCAMYRTHDLLLADGSGTVMGDYTVSVLWSMGGTGAV